LTLLVDAPLGSTCRSTRSSISVGQPASIDLLTRCEFRYRAADVAGARWKYPDVTDFPVRALRLSIDVGRPVAASVG